MATLATLRANLVASTAQFEKGMRRAEKRLERTARKMKRLEDASMKLARGTGLAFAAISGASLLLGRRFVRAASAIEDAQVRLVSLTGSVEKAADTMAFLREVAAGVPFTFEEVVRAGVTVEAMTGRIRELLPVTADLAAVMGLDLPTAASALGRAFAAGAGAADIFRERGILNIIKESQKIEDLTKLTLPEFQRAMIAAFTDPTGKVAGASKRLATTWTGVFSMLQDAVFDLDAALGEVFLPALKNLVDKGLKPAVKRMAEWVKQNRESVVEMVITAGKVIALSAALGAVLLGFSLSVKAMRLFYRTLVFGSKLIRRHPYLFLAAVGVAVALSFQKVREEMERLVRALPGGEKLADVIEGWAEKALKAKDDLGSLIETAQRLMLGGKPPTFVRVAPARPPVIPPVVIPDFKSLEREFQMLREEERALAATQEKLNRMMERGRAVAEAMRTPAEILGDRMEELNELLRVGAIGWEVYASAVHRAQQDFDRAMEEQKRSANALFKGLEDGIRGVESTFANAMANMVTGAKVSFREIARAFIQDVIRAIMRAAVVRPLLGAVGGFLGGMFGGLGGILGGPRMPLPPTQGGGLVTEPHVRLVGEAGPEAIIPLDRLDVLRGMGPESPVVVNQVFNVSPGVPEAVRREVDAMRPLLKQDAIEAIVEARNRGGNVARAMGERGK